MRTFAIPACITLVLAGIPGAAIASGETGSEAFLVDAEPAARLQIVLEGLHSLDSGSRYPFTTALESLFAASFALQKENRLRLQDAEDRMPPEVALSAAAVLLETERLWIAQRGGTDANSLPETLRESREAQYAASNEPAVNHIGEPCPVVLAWCLVLHDYYPVSVPVGPECLQGVFGGAQVWVYVLSANAGLAPYIVIGIVRAPQSAPSWVLGFGLGLALFGTLYPTYMVLGFAIGNCHWYTVFWAEETVTGGRLPVPCGC